MEATILSSLQHPFMVNLKYAFQNPEFLILVMDLVASGDLSEFVLTKKRLTPAQVHWALMEVVEVFGYMHSCMIMYRDLKPENLLVDDEGHVRPIDLAPTLTRTLTRSSTLTLTLTLSLPLTRCASSTWAWPRASPKRSPPAPRASAPTATWRPRCAG